MTGRTVSAYTDEATAAKVAEIARLEDRSPAQIGAAALRFYVRPALRSRPRSGVERFRIAPSGGRLGRRHSGLRGGSPDDVDRP
jgi:hypothetical protein